MIKQPKPGKLPTSEFKTASIETPCEPAHSVPAVGPERLPEVAEPDFLGNQKTLAPPLRGTDGLAAGAGASTTLLLERLWKEYLDELADGRRIVETKAQHDLRVTVAVARLYEYDPPGFSYFLSTKKIGTGRPAKSDFHPIVVHWLRSTGDRTGRSTVLCAVLDEWARSNPRPAPDKIPTWLKEQGGPHAIYKKCRARNGHGEPLDEKDAAFHELCGLPPMQSLSLPPELDGFDGDHLLLAHCDSIRETLEIKGVVRKVDQAWLRANASKILAQRQPGSTPGKPSEPIDEFFTKPEVAKELFQKTLEIVAHRPGYRDVTRWLEPSVGEGAFFDLLPVDKRLGIDIAAKVPRVVEHDFLTYRQFGDHRYFCIGNPPFSNGMAVKFFNWAARVSSYIAFVVTKAFANPSVQGKLHRHFHLLATLPVPDMAFRYGGKEVSVPTIFQIWERRETLRPIPRRETAEECRDLEFLPSAEGASYVLQNVGENAGRSKPLGTDASPGSHFFIRCDADAVAILNSIKWPPRRVGANHLSKSEVIKTYKVKKRALLSKFTH